MPVQPWHSICTIRDDVRSGKLTLAEFAADLYDARTGVAPVVYRDPAMFFDRTYPTYQMKNIGREVLGRLSGQGGKPVLRLQVAYGGGKTHTLLTLLHLAEQGVTLADHRTVKEFLTFAGLTKPPQARVAILPGDKIDVIEGLVVYGPHGQTRRVKTLWGALAYQLAGDAGYARLKAHDDDFTMPAEPLLVDLLTAPQKEGLSTLVLVDEAVLYYRALVNSNPRMLGTIKDFYQLLTQAATKVERAVLVASLMASVIEANDPTGVQCLAALDEVFERIAEPVEPVTRHDIAEILRRRLFVSVPAEAERRGAVDAMMAALNRLPLHDSQRDQVAYDRLLESYPFHPDLINVLYQKWTQLGNFQRTRGALRLFAYALRESEGQDRAPFIGASALLRYQQTPGAGRLSPALDELIELCEESHRWRTSLSGELEKAREIQTSLPTLVMRELEMAVVATFLHSQPAGQRATTPELLGMLAHPTIDPAALEEGLRKWRTRSWFLTENPDLWQLGIVPNLNHMHFHAKNGLTEQEIDDELRKRIQAVAVLKAVDDDVVPHMLPKSPNDVEDNLQLHYLILEPDCAVTPGRPLPAKVEAYFNEKKGLRIYRNNVIALAPEAASVAGLREQVRNWLGWKRLEEPQNFKILTEVQQKQVPKQKQEAGNSLPESVVGAYRLLLAVNEEGAVEVHALSSGGAPFERIKEALIEEERLVVSTLDPDLILPDSYLELWGKGQSSLRIVDLMAVFGQFTRLPRLLRAKSLYETLKKGVQQGQLVIRLPRADGSARTWWLTIPDDDTLRRPETEIQPVKGATLHNLDAQMLLSGRIPDLWPSDATTLPLTTLRSFFTNGMVPRLEQIDILENAIREAVQRGLLLVQHGHVNFYREDLPPGPLNDQLVLWSAPTRISGANLTVQALPAAWQGDSATLPALRDALCAKQTSPLPWTLLQDAINEALSMGLFELASGTWPCSPLAADEVSFRPVTKIEVTQQMVLKAIEYTGSQTPTLTAIKEAIEKYLFGGRPIPAKEFHTVTRRAVDDGVLTALDAWKADNPGAVRVRRPDTVLFGESQLDSMGLQRLAEGVGELMMAAPELSFNFRVALTVEGQVADPAILEQLNKILAGIQEGWRLS